MLLVEQAAVLETDPVKAREIARGHMSIYLGLPNYTNNLKRFGFTDDDIADGGSDRLVDAIVVWGDEAAVAEVLGTLDVSVAVIFTAPVSTPNTSAATCATFWFRPCPISVPPWFRMIDPS